MSRFRLAALALSLLVLAPAAAAHGASVVFVKRNDVWMARLDGSGQLRLTRDGTRRSPYFSPSIADNGTIVALKGIHLHSFARTAGGSSGRASGRSWGRPSPPSRST